MVIVTVLVIAFVVLFPDFYIYSTFLNQCSLAVRLLWWLPLAFMICLILSQAFGIGYSFPLRAFFLMLTCVVLPKFLFAVVSALGKLLGAFSPTAFTVGNVVAALVAVLSLGCFLYGAVWGWKRISLTDKTIAFEQLPPSFDGYKIVQLSDLHVGTYGTDATYFKKMVDMVNAQQPDLVVFTGDIVNSDPKELDPFMHVFSELRAKDGVLSVIGNHDYCTYAVGTKPADHVRMLQDIIDRETGFGWKVLLNENRIIKRGNDSIAIVGVENVGRPPFPSKGDLKKAQEGLNDGVFKVLLSHDPTHWRRETLPDTEIPLQLSGHTHAMQFKVFGWSPSSLTYTEWGGLYESDGQKLFISTGGGGNVPFRFGAWPEVAVLTLKCAQ